MRSGDWWRQAAVIRDHAEEVAGQLLELCLFRQREEAVLLLPAVHQRIVNELLQFRRARDHFREVLHVLFDLVDDLGLGGHVQKRGNIPRCDQI